MPAYGAMNFALNAASWFNALKTFEGTVMYVSHDRHFLHGLSNRVFEVDKGGIRVFDSNFQYYLDKKKSEG